mmetsp:Transcript_118182/g.329591  ORF Transcript_118182/g.329591 Transcript_118182/m.329591 type:complete len:756 (+) Transcript_118182:59-2326(+)
MNPFRTANSARSSINASRTSFHSSLNASLNGSTQNDFTTWRYVGPGRGRYARIEQVQFVGDGFGSFTPTPEPPTITQPWALRACCGGFGCFMLVACLYIVVAMLGPPSSFATRQRWESRPSDLHPAHARGALLVEPKEPYDCRAGYINAERGWSFEKKVWCCSHYKVACPSKPTTTEPFNCRTGYAFWKAVWTDQKKQWCCKHYYPLGCEWSTSRAPAGNTSSSRAPANNVSTSNASAGKSSTSRAPEGYECAASNFGEVSTWSARKRSWCCAHEATGCAMPSSNTVAPRTTTATSTASASTTTTTASATSSTTASSTFQAVASLPASAASTAPTTTTPPVTTTHTTTVPTTTHTAAPTMTTTGTTRTATTTATATSITATATATTTTTSDEYDCDAGVLRWEDGWSPSKKAWCCAHVSVGCPTTATASPAAVATTTAERSAAQLTAVPLEEEPAAVAPEREAPQVLAAAPALAVPEAPSRSEAPLLLSRASAKPGFNCSDGLEQALLAWSAGKQAWCCLHKSLGCTEEPMADAPFAEPIECNASSARAQIAEDVGLQAWCCLHKNLWCSVKQPAATAAPEATGASTPLADSAAIPAAADALNEQPPSGCETRCSAGGLATTCGARIRWAAAFKFPQEVNACPLAHGSVLKECPACAVCPLGLARCASQAEMLELAKHAPYKCGPEDGNAASGWSRDKRTWCCEHAGRGCSPRTPAAYDCSEHVKEREATWSEEKKAWCCERWGLACAPSPSGAR